MRGRLAEVIRTFREQRRFGDGFDILTASFVFVFTVLKLLMKELTQKKQVGITIPEKAIETNGEGFVDFWIFCEAPSISGRPNCKGDVEE